MQLATYSYDTISFHHILWSYDFYPKMSFIWYSCILKVKSIYSNSSTLNKIFYLFRIWKIIIQWTIHAYSKFWYVILICQKIRDTTIYFSSICLFIICGLILIWPWHNFVDPELVIPARIRNQILKELLCSFVFLGNILRQDNGW